MNPQGEEKHHNETSITKNEFRVLIILKIRIVGLQKMLSGGYYERLAIHQIDMRYWISTKM